VNETPRIAYGFESHSPRFEFCKQTLDNVFLDVVKAISNKLFEVDIK